MFLLRETSRGLIGLKFLGAYGQAGGRIMISLSDDQGWMEDLSMRGPMDSDAEAHHVHDAEVWLGEAIAEETGVPLEEAIGLAAVGISGWRELVSPREGRTDLLKGYALITAIGGTVLLLLLLLVIAVIALTMFLTDVL